MWTSGPASTYHMAASYPTTTPIATGDYSQATNMYDFPAATGAKGRSLSTSTMTVSSGTDIGMSGINVSQSKLPDHCYTMSPTALPSSTYALPTHSRTMTFADGAYDRSSSAWSGHDAHGPFSGLATGHLPGDHHTQPMFTSDDYYGSYDIAPTRHSSSTTITPTPQPATRSSSTYPPYPVSTTYVHGSEPRGPAINPDYHRDRKKHQSPSTSKHQKAARQRYN